MNQSPMSHKEQPEEQPTPAEVMEQVAGILAHAWMVRTFVKHCEESEEFPELYKMGRSIFDLCRALETRLDDPAGYFRMLHKKLGRFSRAVDQFREDVAEASEHTNFRQAVLSIEVCRNELRRLVERGEAALAAERNADSPSEES